MKKSRALAWRGGHRSGDLDQLAGKNNTFGAVGAPDNPLRGLMSEKAAHCDPACHCRYIG
jgi:hypothetical protein